MSAVLFCCKGKGRSLNPNINICDLFRRPFLSCNHRTAEWIYCIREEETPFNLKSFDTVLNYFYFCPRLPTYWLDINSALNGICTRLRCSINVKVDRLSLLQHTTVTYHFPLAVFLYSCSWVIYIFIVLLKRIWNTLKQ